MPVKTKIDIFKNMKKSELEDEIRNYTLHYRYYQRLLAIKMVSEGNSITEVANQINKAYPTVHKWISTCEKEGLEGLKPSFVGGGHNAKLNNNQLLQLDKIIAENPNMTLKELEQEKQIRESLFKITHEIKNPITVCKGYLDMFDVEDKKKSEKYVSILKDEIKRVLVLLEDFLSINKINSYSFK